MKNLKNCNLFWIIIIVIFSFLFYWFEYNPNQIKKRCSAEARFNTEAVLESNYKKRQDFINSYYNDCLMRFGLK